MDSDSYSHINREALARSIAEADHLLFRFATVASRLFVDFRVGADLEPGIHVLPPVNSLAERVASIRRVRPQAPLPDRLYVIAIPARVRGLDRTGALDAIRRRLAQLEAFTQVTELELAYEQLLAFEREEIRRAITGDGYRTLWARTAG
jgi:hypothetical protein